MRTTINLHDDLLAFAKQKAAETHQTLTSVVEDAIRLLMSKGRIVGDSVPRTKLPAFKGNGLRPGVNLDNTAELIDRMEGRL